MSGSGRRRSSKWDLKEEILPENHCESAHSNKDGSSFHEHESGDRMPGRRDIQKAECMNEQSIPAFDGDAHYATGKLAVLDGWSQRNQGRSPRRSRGRSYRSRSRSKSRSRSPARNPQPERSLNDQSSRSGHSAPLCRDFAAGRCRKGYLCHFAHHGRLDHESRRHLERRVGSDRESMHRDDEALRSHSGTYSTRGRSTNFCNDFLKGRCRRGASCKYPHHDSGSDEFGKGALDGGYQDGDSDGISKDGHSYDRKPRHSSEILCKFFAAGNCLNGRHCKFSHHQNEPSVERQPKCNLDGMHEVQNDAKRGDTTLANVPKAHGWDEDIARGASAEVHYASGQMQADAAGDYMQQNPSIMLDVATTTANNASSCMNQSVSSNVPPGQGIQIPYHQATLDTKPAEGHQIQPTSLTHHPAVEVMQKPHHETVLDSKPDDGAYMANTDVSQTGSGTTLGQSNVLRGQLSQISNLSTTLAELEKSQQLPQLYADVAQTAVVDGGSDLLDSSASVPQVSATAFQLNQATNTESTRETLLFSNSVEQSSLLGTSEIPSSTAIPTSLVTGKMPASSDFLKVGSSGDELGYQSLDLNPQRPASKEEENEGATGKGANEAQEQRPGEDVALNGGFNDEKKANDAQEMRPFKFALAEFVKELLRPTWKDGQMSKEVYKTIVKKVVDKVTDSIQPAHIPRTKEKIDQYLSFSKPKLIKLLQAYVEKYQKN